jgi:hypothetical protein
MTFTPASTNSAKPNRALAAPQCSDEEFAAAEAHYAAEQAGQAELPTPSPETFDPAKIRTQYKELLRWRFTVRRPLVKQCGHKINIAADPRNNCPSCWFAFFQSNGQITQIADECFTEAGRDVLERSRGKKFTRFFLMFMSTIARFQREAEEAAAKGEQNEVDGTERSTEDAGTRIGQVAGDVQSIGGLEADSGCTGHYIPEEKDDQAEAGRTGLSGGTVRQRLVN